MNNNSKIKQIYLSNCNYNINKQTNAKKIGTFVLRRDKQYGNFILNLSRQKSNDHFFSSDNTCIGFALVIVGSLLSNLHKDTFTNLTKI